MQLKRTALAVIVSCMSLSATATDYEVNGTFTYANDVLLIPFTLDQQSTVTFYTDSAFGTALGHYGFDPMLMLYSADGERIGFTGSAPSDKYLGTEDVWMSRTLAAGIYYLGLSKQAHEVIGPIRSPLYTSLPVSDLQGWVDGIEVEGDVTDRGRLHDNFSLQLEGVSSIGSPYYTSGVTIVSVPEPETYAMFLAGLGIVGAIARRRRKTAN